jgi:hypothetical protein
VKPALPHIVSLIGVVLAGASLAACFPGGSELGRNTDNWIWNIDWIRAVA